MWLWQSMEWRHCHWRPVWKGQNTPDLDSYLVGLKKPNWIKSRSLLSRDRSIEFAELLGKLSLEAVWRTQQDIFMCYWPYFKVKRRCVKNGIRSLLSISQSGSMSEITSLNIHSLFIDTSSSNLISFIEVWGLLMPLSSLCLCYHFIFKSSLVFMVCDINHSLDSIKCLVPLSCHHISLENP